MFYRYEIYVLRIGGRTPRRATVQRDLSKTRSNYNGGIQKYRLTFSINGMSHQQRAMNHEQQNKKRHCDMLQFRAV